MVDSRRPPVAGTTPWRRAKLALAALIGAAFGSLSAQAGVRGFVDVTARTGNANGSAGFALGQFDLFFVTRLNEKLHFLGETVFESDDGEFVVDVERVIVTYALRRELQFSIGRHHTPIGYWNNAYHHGALIQPTIERPLLFRFEDDGGVLPVHTVGLAVSGREVGSLRLGYEVMIGNGIGSTAAGDNDRAKSVAAAIHSQVNSRLRLGASAYSDRIAAGTVSPGGGVLAAPVRQLLVGGFGRYDGERLEVIVEYQRPLNRTPGGPNRGGHFWTFYLGHAIGPVTGYGRVDGLRFDARDPYYTVPRQDRFAVGARIDLDATAVAKLEFQSGRVGSGAHRGNLVLQVAVGF